MNLSAFSLFSGAGGLDLGVENAGFRTVFAVEYEQLAVDTLNANRKRYFRELPLMSTTDVTSVEPRSLMRRLGIRKGEIDLLIGGPPCVAFSKSGFHLDYKREGRDPRANLLQDYFRFLEGMKPRAFMLENVFGLAYRNHSAPFLDALLKGIASIGYSVTLGVLNAADFGVPQNRQRLFIVGSRDGKELRLPRPTHWGALERRAKPVGADKLQPHVTAGVALSEVTSGPEPQERVNGKYGHLLAEIPPGGNYQHYTEHEGHPRPLFKWRSRFWTFLLKLDPNRPASTIQGQPGPYVGPFHWENRRLRVPELKRLQSFPDDYEFCGSRRDVQLQIGNSVPPGLAQAVAAALRFQLEGGTVDPVADQLELVAL